MTVWVLVLLETDLTPQYFLLYVVPIIVLLLNFFYFHIPTETGYEQFWKQENTKNIILFVLRLNLLYPFNGFV